MLTHQEKMRLAVAANVSLKTAEKWLKRGTVTGANGDALLRAMAQLGFALDNEDPAAEKAAP